MALALRNRPACVPTQRVRKGRALLPVRVPLAPGRRQADMRVFAKEDMDFDAVLNVWAEKYEKLENKPVVIGYIIATVTAFIFVEWLIHLPALDIVLGFPLQLLGVLLAPVLAVRYLVDKKDVAGDVLDAVGELTKNLPGLDTKKN